MDMHVACMLHKHYTCISYTNTIRKSLKYAHTCTHTYTILAAPPTKKYKKEKSKVEKAMEKTMDVFIKAQLDAEERFQKREEER